MINMEELKRSNKIIESLNRLKIIKKKLYDGTSGYRLGLVDAYMDDSMGSDRMFINSLSERYCNWFMELLNDQHGDLDSFLFDLIDDKIKALESELSELIKDYK